jgi:hypothetical protein
MVQIHIPVVRTNQLRLGMTVGVNWRPANPLLLRASLPNAILRLDQALSSGSEKCFALSEYHAKKLVTSGRARLYPCGKRGDTKAHLANKWHHGVF